MNIFGIYIIEFLEDQTNKLKEEELKFSKKIEETKQKEKNKLDEEFKKILKEKCNNNEAAMNQIMNKVETKNILEQQKKK